jgi:hypothetical protein
MGMYNNMVHHATHMLLKDVFDKATFYKVNIWKKIKLRHWWKRYKKTKTHDENPDLPMGLMNFKNLKKKPTNVCDFQKDCLAFGKEIHRLAYGFGNLWQNYSLAYWFSFFVISISGGFFLSSIHSECRYQLPVVGKQTHAPYVLSSYSS